MRLSSMVPIEDRSDVIALLGDPALIKEHGPGHVVLYYDVPDQDISEHVERYGGGYYRVTRPDGTEVTGLRSDLAYLAAAVFWAEGGGRNEPEEEEG